MTGPGREGQWMCNSSKRLPRDMQESALAAFRLYPRTAPVKFESEAVGCSDETHARGSTAAAQPVVAPVGFCRPYSRTMLGSLGRCLRNVSRHVGDALKNNVECFNDNNAPQHPVCDVWPPPAPTAEVRFTSKSSAPSSPSPSSPAPYRRRRQKSKHSFATCCHLRVGVRHRSPIVESGPSAAIAWKTLTPTGIR